MDTVDLRFADEWMANLEGVLQGREPATLVCLHIEPDHSGVLERAMRRWPSMRFAATKKALQMLPQFVADAALFDGRTIALDDGATLPVGDGESLTFRTAPMVHWPEVAVAWYEPAGTLFSADAFGTFGTAPFPADWAPEGARYYTNICGKYGPQVQALLRKVGDLPIQRICSLHGPVYEGDMVPRLIDLYDKWSRYEPDTERVLVAYASIYGNTRLVADEIARMLTDRGAEVEVVDLARVDVSYAVAAAFRSPKWVLAASSYDAGVFPPMHNFLYHLKIKGMRNRRVALIQNASWAPSATRLMHAMVEAMPHMDIIPETGTIMTRLRPADLPSLAALAAAL